MHIVREHGVPHPEPVLCVGAMWVKMKLPGESIFKIMDIPARGLEKFFTCVYQGILLPVRMGRMYLLVGRPNLTCRVKKPIPPETMPASILINSLPKLEGRESTQMPNRMFVTVDYNGDGSDQPDWKAATKSIELLKKFSQDDQPFFLATGLVRPHYPNVAPKQYFDQYPIQKINLPYVPRDDWKDMPKAAISNSNSKAVELTSFKIIKSACGRATWPRLLLLMNKSVESPGT